MISFCECAICRLEWVIDAETKDDSCPYCKLLTLESKLDRIFDILEREKK